MALAIGANAVSTIKAAANALRHAAIRGTCRKGRRIVITSKYL
jgi:hypothetical protein